MRISLFTGSRGAGHVCLSAVLVFLISSAEGRADDVVTSQEGTAGGVETIEVLSKEDYRSLTGCGSADNYAHALENALRYLTFAEGQDEAARWDYRRRHIRPVFKGLADDNGFVPAKCLPDSVRQIGLGMDVLTSDAPTGTDSPRFFYNAGSDAFPDETGLTLTVTSRRAYMSATGCLLSPSSWEHYETAVFTYIDMDVQGEERLAEDMLRLFADLKSSRPTDAGLIADMCWTDGLRKMAQAAGLAGQ